MRICSNEGITEGSAMAMISDAQPRTFANIESFVNLVEETRGAGSLGDVGKVERSLMFHISPNI